MNASTRRLLAATALALASTAASAHDVQWAVTIGSGGFGGVAVGIPGPVFAPAPVVVAPPVVVMPPRVVVAPPVWGAYPVAPVRYAPVVVAPPRHWHPGGGHRHGHGGYRAGWGGGYVQYRH